MVVILMGVAGSGKTLIGSTLAKSLDWKFADADDFHSAANVEKMSRGIPLTDEDREPWLRAMRNAIDGWIKSGQDAVLACSALKQRYRDQLNHVSGHQVRVPERHSRSDLQPPLAAPDHFMKPEMLASQFADLEEPADAIIVDVSGPPDQIVAEIKHRLCD